MQYLLTEEELNNLVPISRYKEKCKEVEQLNKLVLKVANYKCIHDRVEEDEEIYGDELVCDDCPLKWTGTCHKAKSFSQ